MQSTFQSIVDDVYQMQGVLEPYLKKTPLQFSSSGLSSSNHGLLLKREDLQHTNSFTVRAALGIFSDLSPEQWRRGLVFTTPGNLGWGFIFALKTLGRDLKITIVIPEDAVEAKVTELKGCHLPNVRVVQQGMSETERYEVVREISVNEGCLPLSLGDRRREVAAKGTLAVEILAQLQALVSVASIQKIHFYCPVGSGALLTGCSPVLRASLKQKVRIIAVEPMVANDFYRLFNNDHQATTMFQSTLADSLRSPHVREEYRQALLDNVDEVIAVEEEEIVSAMRELYKREGISAEPSAAISVAAFLKDQPKRARELSVALVTAGNVDRSRFPFFN